MFGPAGPAKVVLRELDAVKAVEEILAQLGKPMRQHLKALLDDQASPTVLPPGAFWVTNEEIMSVTKNNAQLSGHILTVMHRSGLFHSLTLGSHGTYNDRVSSSDLLAHVDELLKGRRSGMGDITRAAIMRLVKFVQTKDTSAASTE